MYPKRDYFSFKSSLYYKLIQIIDHMDQYIRFRILVKKQNISFRIKNSDLDFSKETQRYSRKHLSIKKERKLGIPKRPSFVMQ